MIGSSIEEMLTSKYENEYMIDSDNVAHVMCDNTALHAAIVLVSVGYNSIPVLDKENHLLGTVSLANILQSLFDSENDNYQEYLSSMSVKEIMNKDIKSLQIPFGIEEMMHHLVDSNYVPVVNADNQFIGILTRKELIKAINYLAHEYEKEYDVKPKKVNE